MLRLSTFLSLSFKHRLNPSEDQYTYGYNFIYGLAGLEIEKPYNNNLFNGVRSLTAETKTYLLCADDYEATPTVDKFIKLLNKKDFYKRNNDSNSVLEKAKLEDQLNEVLNKIRWIKSFDELADFRKVPLELIEKIKDNEPLRFSIKNDVDIYYNYVRKQLSELDDVGSEFRVIASQFQICYEKLSTVMSDQEEIYNKIINWVLDELGLGVKYQTAAKIIVSFFVQNCEVFDEIS